MLSRQRTIRFYYVLKLTTKIWALSKRFFYDAKLFESSFECNKDPISGAVTLRSVERSVSECGATFRKIDDDT